jgi:parafibromin
VSGGLLEYEIVDNPRKLGHKVEDWERIVAVVVLGQAWQFKDWLRGYNMPATLFDKVYGFYVGMEGDKLPADVQGWAVRKAVLNRDKRGLDSVTHASFWNGLDEFMKVHKAELLPQHDMV